VVNPAVAGLYQLSYRGICFQYSVRYALVVNPAPAGLYQLSYRGIWCLKAG